MTAVFEQYGIRFLYPENWRLTEDNSVFRTTSVSVEAPSGAFWTVDLHASASDLKSLIDDILEAMQGEYTEIDASQVEETIVGRQSIGYDLYFYCMDLLVNAKVRALDTSVGAMVIHYQAEDRDFDKLEPVFQAMNQSLLEGESPERPN